MKGDSPIEATGTVLPLRDRLPDYAVIFAVAGVGAAAAGAALAAMTGAGLASGAAYGLMGLGTLLLLAGGATGGGYTNLSVGALGALFGGDRNRTDEDVADPSVRRGKITGRDPRERLRKGLRPGPNPRAFWQVIAGAAYLAIGILIVSNWA